MKKLPTMFVRKPAPDGRGLVTTSEPKPGLEMVFDGRCVARRKYNGTACMVRGGRLYKRYELKSDKTAPDGYEPSQDPDPNTGKRPGWVPVGDGPEDARHREAFKGDEPDGTYELCGPKVERNPEGFDRHVLVPHAEAEAVDVPLTYDALKEFMRTFQHEGVVFWFDGQPIAKIRREDFGF